jgi:hypothetical protein
MFVDQATDASPAVPAVDESGVLAEVALGGLDPHGVAGAGRDRGSAKLLNDDRRSA